MKLFLQTVAAFILFSSLTFAQVVVDSINIRASFYGPFNKIIAEIYFNNYSNRDSLEARFNFKRISHQLSPIFGFK